jgi:peptidoglycan-associated lipoprotein
MDYLTTLGIAASRLSTVSYGEEIPVCKEHNEGCWVKNRRARFVVSQTKPTS